MKIAAGMPPLYANTLLGTLRAARRGDFAKVDTTLEALIGRSPKTNDDMTASSMHRAGAA